MCGSGKGGQGWAGFRNVGGPGWLRPARLGARAPYLPPDNTPQPISLQEKFEKGKVNHLGRE